MIFLHLQKSKSLITQLPRWTNIHLQINKQGIIETSCFEIVFPFPSCNNFSKINFPRILPNSMVFYGIKYFSSISSCTIERYACICVYHARHHLEWKYSEFFAASLSRGFASEEAYATRYSNRCITCVIAWPRLVRTYVLATCVKMHTILSSYTAVQYFFPRFELEHVDKKKERERRGKKVTVN